MSFEYFDVTPKVIRVNTPTVVTIKPRYEQRQFDELLKAGSTLKLSKIAVNGLLDNGQIAGWAQFEDAPFTLTEKQDALQFTVVAAEEGEISYKLMYELNGRKFPLVTFGVYALEPDLFQLRPFRGDMHVHTSCSECGNRDENPRFVAAVACEVGLDFIAITDHTQMEPSVDAIEFLKPFNLDFQVFRGEEVHLLGQPLDSLFCKNRFTAPLHIVNFGGSQGVAKFQNEHFDEVQKIIDENAEKLDPSLPLSVRKYQAASDWIFDKIREFGGLSIFAHPFWKPELRDNLPAPVRDYILKQNKYDAMEVIGLGANVTNREGNWKCIAWWQDASIKAGRKINLVSNTDSHSSRAVLNQNASIIFAKANTFEAIAEAIRDGRSVAGTFYRGSGPELLGDLRYVSFAYYLMREFYPEHDAACKLVGGLMSSYLRGACSDEAVKAAGQKHLQNLFDKYWAN